MGTVLEATAGSGSDGVRDGAMDLSPVCPQCGYDLRGADTGRCPECGFDRALIADPTSTIPWVHRRELGRVRSWVRTVWQFTTRSRWLALEAARPVSVREAKRFWLITATLLSLPFIVEISLLWYDARSLRFITDIFVAPAIIDSTGPMAPVFYSVTLPWAAGATRPGVLHAGVWLCALLCTGVQTYLFHPRGLDRRRADRAIALGYYLGGTLVLPLAMLTIVWISMRLRISLPPDLERASEWALLTGAAVLGVNALARHVITLALTTRCGWPYLAMSAVAIPASWLLCAAFALGFLPWVIGYVWITIDSFL